MKYTIVTSFLFLLVLCTQAQSSKQAASTFTVKAKINGMDAKQIYLTYGGFHNSKIDTAQVVNGAFSFKGKVDEPVPAMVFTPDYKVRFDLYIDNGAINISGSANALDDLKISGPAVTNEFVAFNKTIMDNRKKVNTIYQQSHAAFQKGDSVTGKKLQKEMETFYNKEFAIRKGYIKDHPKSFIGAYELYAFSNVKTVKEATTLYEALDERVQNSSQGVALLERLQLLGRVQVGEPALAFVQQDVNGKEISLDAYKGKYVLVEFWASWCGPCRAENPNLLNAYNQYKDKGFTILGISLDHSKEAWLKAIEKDGMPWIQVSDLKGWNNVVAEMYGIKAIPANFLVSPEGKILALDLRGELLHENLNKIIQ